MNLDASIAICSLLSLVAFVLPKKHSCPKIALIGLEYTT